jgi:hypothetical protein
MIEHLRALHARIGRALAELEGLEPVLAAWQALEAPTEPQESLEPVAALTTLPPNGAAAPGEAPAQGAGLVEVACPNCSKRFTKRAASKRIWCGKRCKMRVYARRNAERRRAAEPDPAPLPDFTERDLRVRLAPEASDPELLKPPKLTWELNGEASP